MLQDKLKNINAAGIGGFGGGGLHTTEMEEKNATTPISITTTTTTTENQPISPFMAPIVPVVDKNDDNQYGMGSNIFFFFKYRSLYSNVYSPVPNALEGQLTLSNAQYLSEYSDSNSSAFKTLASELEEELKDALRSPGKGDEEIFVKIMSLK
jgi:hypothetical protein